MKKLIIFVIAFLVIVLGVVTYLFFGNYSEGYRAGTMVKFSQKGYLFKTYEGELNLGMILNDQSQHTPTEINNIWSFSVSGGKDSTIKTINEALLSGKRVKLHYREKFYRFFWRGDTKYFVDEAEIVK
ncbi:MAG TPA: hypothetical protein VNW99_02740 [Cytophagaceae bacterium]|jgi:hypothetical protein|nr:hypothetical protein [Cytophagaceae bacterium]